MVKKNFSLSLVHKNEVEQNKKNNNNNKIGKLMKFLIIETSNYVNFFI